MGPRARPAWLGAAPGLRLGSRPRGGANLNLKRQALRGEWGPGKQTPESESRSRTEIPRDSPIQVPDFAGKWGPNPRFPVGRAGGNGHRGLGGGGPAREISASGRKSGFRNSHEARGSLPSSLAASCT